MKRRSGIDRLHAHLLRHTFATNYLLAGLGDLHELSQILGHGDIKTTTIYLHTAGYYAIGKQKGKSYLEAGYYAIGKQKGKSYLDKLRKI